MTAEEVIKAIQQAQRAIATYNNQLIEKTASFSQDDSVRLRTSFKGLIKEGRFYLGPAGNTCPTCGGSGKI